MTMPNFLVIGVGKAGTTSLHHYLKQHPDIFMSPSKEPSYFSMVCIDPDKLRTRTWWKNKVIVSEPAAYQALFDGARGQSAIGECSPVYFSDPAVPKRIRDDLPDVKLIAVLRHPVDRAYSQYSHRVRDGLERCRSFAEAFHRNRPFSDRPGALSYREKGFYFPPLQRYFRHFHRNRLKIFLYEDLCAGAADMLRDIFTYLEVEPDFEIDMRVKYNLSGTPRSVRLQRALDPNSSFASWVRRFVPPALASRVRQGVQRVNLERTALRPSLRAELTEDFREDILKTQDLIDRDLTHWFTGTSEAEKA